MAKPQRAAEALPLWTDSSASSVRLPTGKVSLFKSPRGPPNLPPSMGATVKSWARAAETLSTESPDAGVKVVLTPGGTRLLHTEQVRVHQKSAEATVLSSLFEVIGNNPIKVRLPRRRRAWRRRRRAWRSPSRRTRRRRG